MGEPGIPIDSTFVQTQAFLELLERLRDYTAEHHRDHWVQCCDCERWRIVDHTTATAIADEDEWSCSMLCPPSSSCTTPLSNRELVGDRYTAGTVDFLDGTAGECPAADGQPESGKVNGMLGSITMLHRPPVTSPAPRERAGPGVSPDLALPTLGLLGGALLPGLPHSVLPGLMLPGAQPARPSGAFWQPLGQASGRPGSAPLPAKQASACNSGLPTESTAPGNGGPYQPTPEQPGPPPQGVSREALQEHVRLPLRCSAAALAGQEEEVLSAIELARQARIAANRAYLSSLGLAPSAIRTSDMAALAPTSATVLAAARELAHQAALNQAKRQLEAAQRQYERARCERCKHEPALLAELCALRELEDSTARQLDAAQRTEAEVVAALTAQHSAMSVAVSTALDRLS